MKPNLLFSGLMIAALFGLAGCVEDSHSSYSRPVYSNSNSYSAPSHYERNTTQNLDDKQEKALVDGCRARYGNDRRRFNECVSGNRHSDEALDQGCYMRYRGNPKKLRECLDN